MEIILRPWQKEDATALATIANNAKIAANVRDRFPHPYTVNDAQQWIQLNQHKIPCENFAIIFENELAGSIGCLPKDDVYRKNIEVGYFIAEKFWGKGIASKALSVLLEYIPQRFDVTRVYAEVFETNTASMKVLQKNGFYLESIRRKAVIKNGSLLDDYLWVKHIN